jgi:hypothetical protein
LAGPSGLAVLSSSGRVLVRVPAWARRHAWDCVQGALAFGMGRFSGAGFLETMAVRHYYQLKIITEQLPITPQRHRAHKGRTKTFKEQFSGRLRRTEDAQRLLKSNSKGSGSTILVSSGLAGPSRSAAMSPVVHSVG